MGKKKKQNRTSPHTHTHKKWAAKQFFQICVFCVKFKTSSCFSRARRQRKQTRKCWNFSCVGNMRWWCAWSTRDPRSWALSCVRVWRMLSERSWFGYCTKLLVLRAAISHLPCYFKMSWFWGCILHLPLQGCVSSEASGDTKWELSCCWCVMEELGGREDIVMPISPATCGWKPMVVNVFFSTMALDCNYDQADWVVQK